MPSVSAVSDAQKGCRSFCLENHRIARRLIWEPGAGLRTVSLYDKASDTEYALAEPGCEFLVEINGKIFFGYKKETVHLVDGEVQRSGLKAELHSVQQTAALMKIRLYLPEVDAVVSVCYQLLEGQPAMAKWLEVFVGSRPLTVRKLYFEVLNIAPGIPSETEYFIRHGLVRAERMFVTGGSEDILQAHLTERRRGYFLANSAPGPLNRFLVYPQWSDTAVSVGYNSDTAPFHKYLGEGECFVSHRSLIMLYEGERDSVGVRNQFRACLRAELPAAAADALMYCTWIPFLKNINEALLIDLAEAAASIHASTFVVDDGWFVEGGWRVDKGKFPNGLEPVAEKVRSLGMRFGLWFNIGTDYGIEGMRPDENAKDSTGCDKYNGFVARSAVKCLASTHRDYLIETLAGLAERYKVGYFKLDFSSIISPYGLMPVGCHSHEHQHHRDGADAVYEQYASLSFIREQLKARFPDLILDFSFESFGTDFPNLAALQVSELHHSSNLNTRNRQECSARHIRNVLYRFNTVLPVERIMGSLICLEADDAAENLLTAMAGAPLVAGDIRQLPDHVRQQIRTLLAGMADIQKNGLLSEFIKLRGDRHIQRWEWDGFCRFNPSGGGFICLFSNESREEPHFQIDLPWEGTVSLVEVETGELAYAGAVESLRHGIELPWINGKAYRCLSLLVSPRSGPGSCGLQPPREDSEKGDCFLDETGD